MNFIYAAVALLGLLVGAIWFSMEPAEGPQSIPALPKIDAAAIVDIRIEATGLNNHLHKSMGQWMLDGNPADGELVQRLLTDLAGMQPVRLLTRNAGRYGELGLAEDAVHLTPQDSAKAVLADIYVGKQGTDILSTYVRFAGMDAVIAVDRTLVWQVRRSKQGWLAPEKPEDAGELST